MRSSIATYLAAAAAPGIALGDVLTLYPFRLDPAQHPSHGRTHTTPPTWPVFGNSTIFATLRGFEQTPNQTIFNYEADLSQYAQFGSVMWPDYMTAFAPNFAQVVSYMAGAGFYMTDLWGYVPGSGPGPEMWQAFTPPASSLASASAILGDRWFGMDVGEQDGRFIGSYTDQYAPLDASPRQQLEFFDAHFTAMQQQLGSRVVALTSLTFPHYMAASGVYTLLGCETAQALVNGQIFYAFVRGAGKTYGLLYFGNVSVYSRFGYKTYPGADKAVAHASPRWRPTEPEADRRRRRSGTKAAPRASAPQPFACTNQGQGGPTCGTSLSLMARLMMAQVYYDSAYVSFENDWFEADGTTISPVGQLQLAIKAWLASNGAPGTHLATNALLLDYHAGYTAPRHLYTDALYRVWGNLPYSVQRGDFLADGVLRMFYPQYQDSSYFHDETGFSSATPYGDSLDVLLSDAPAWLLQRYDTVVVAGTPTSEVAWLSSKLTSYLANGGRVIAWAGALAALSGSGGLAGCTAIASACPVLPAQNITVTYPGYDQVQVSDVPFAACPVTCTGASVQTVASTASGTPVAWLATTAQGGELLIFAAPYGVVSTAAPINGNDIDESLTSPFPLAVHVTAVLDAALSSRLLVSTSPGLTFTVCRNGTASAGAGSDVGVYHMLVSNPSLAQQPFGINVNAGELVSLEELPLQLDSVKAAVGYLPDGYQGSDLGNSTTTTIAGVDTRVFRLLINESLATGHEQAGPSAVRVLGDTVPPARPRNVGINLHGLRGLGVSSLREAVLAYPSLQQFFDVIVVDYNYLTERTPAALQAEAAWLATRGISVIPDFTPGLNLFPHLRLFNNSAPEYVASIATLHAGIDAVATMNGGAASHAIISLHRVPENNMDAPTAMGLMAQTLQQLAPYAAAQNVTLHLRHTFKNGMSLSGLQGWLSTNNLLGSIAIAPTTATMIRLQDSTASLTAALTAWPGMSILAVSAPDADWTGSYYSETLPVLAAPPFNQLVVSGLLQAACTAKGPCASAGSRTLMLIDAQVGGGVQGGMDPSVMVSAAAGAGIDAAYFDAAWALAQPGVGGI